MESDEREDETFQVLNQVVESSQTVGILTAVYVYQTSYLACVKADVLVLVYYFQLLSAITETDVCSVRPLE